jgi:hypothetical protein
MPKGLRVQVPPRAFRSQENLSRARPGSTTRRWRNFGKLTRDPAVLGLTALAEIKKNNREKDYAVIGELARLMKSPREQLLYSRSARDLLALTQAHPQLANELSVRRPLLRQAGVGRAQLEEALDAERRSLIHANEERLARYREASKPWAAAWSNLEKEIGNLSLPAAHEIVVARAVELLPFTP